MQVVIELDGPTLSAVKVDVRSDSVTIKSWHTETCPETVDRADDRSMLQWATGALKSWNLGRGRYVCCVPRAEVVLKRLHISGAAGADDDDRAGIVALQMSRQLSLSMQDPQVDYVPIGQEAGDSSLDVIAAALPGTRLSWLRSLVRGAGAKLDRVGLRSEGVGTLVTGAAPDQSGAILGVSLGDATADFVIVEDGELRFARGADAGRLGSSADEADALQIAVEAKRTWMSYRMGSTSVDVDRVVVLGEGELAAQVAERSEAELELPAETLKCPAFVSFDDNVPSEDRRAALPLVGLVAQEIVGTQGLNFAKPRRAADRGASTRQRALLALLGIIVIAGAGYLFAQNDLQNLEQTRKRLRGDVAQLQETYLEALRREARAEHAEHFLQSDVDWIAELARLSETMPDPREAIASQYRATAAPLVTFAPRVSEDDEGRRVVRYTGGTWSHLRRVVAVIDGQVARREVADDLRTRLIDGGVYSVDTRGPDDESKFSFELTTDLDEEASR